MPLGKRFHPYAGNFLIPMPDTPLMRLATVMAEFEKHGRREQAAIIAWAEDPKLVRDEDLLELVTEWWYEAGTFFPPLKSILRKDKRFFYR